MSWERTAFALLQLGTPRFAGFCSHQEDGFPESGLPTLTFSEVMSLHFNDEIVDLYFMPGHSDSDVVVHFRKANITCIGDYGFFEDGFAWPGLSANVYDMETSMISMTELFSDDVLIVRGHEDEMTMPELKTQTDLITETIKLVSPLIQQGLTLEQIKERDPLKSSSYALVRDNRDRWIENIFNDRQK